GLGGRVDRVGADLADLSVRGISRLGRGLSRPEEAHPAKRRDYGSFPIHHRPTRCPDAGTRGGGVKAELAARERPSSGYGQGSASGAPQNRRQNQAPEPQTAVTKL